MIKKPKTSASAFALNIRENIAQNFRIFNALKIENFACAYIKADSIKIIRPLSEICRKMRQISVAGDGGGVQNLTKMISTKKLGKICPETEILKIFDVEAERGVTFIEGLPLSLIEDEVGVSHNTLKRHLRTLRDAGVLKFNLKGTFVLNPDVFDLEHCAAVRTAELPARKIQYDLFVSD